jgi:uncharacterized protein (TIGR00730 family)
MVIRDVKEIKKALSKKAFRVAIFGSARIKPKHKAYQEVYNLAQMIGKEDIDLVTGGGPGLMLAANSGHLSGKIEKGHSHSIGLLINIPNEHRKSHVDIQQSFTKFSDRLDNFMLLSNAVVVAPGGVGTMLELFYTWQLLQVHKIKHIPVILMGGMWIDFVKWMKSHPVACGFISNEDLKLIKVAKNAKEAMQIIDKEYRKYKKR